MLTNQDVRLIMKNLLLFGGYYLQIKDDGFYTRARMDDFVRAANTGVPEEVAGLLQSNLAFAGQISNFATAQDNYAKSLAAAAMNYLTYSASKILGMTGTVTPQQVVNKLAQVNNSLATVDRYGQHVQQSLPDGTDEVLLYNDGFSGGQSVVDISPLVGGPISFDLAAVCNHTYRRNTIYEAVWETIYDALTISQPNDLLNDDGTAFMSIYVGVNHAGNSYPINTSHWLPGIRNNSITNLSAIPVHTTFHDNAQGGGVLVSPRHLFSFVGLPSGTTVKFRAANGTTSTRTVGSPVSTNLGGFVNLLSADVAAGVNFAKMLQADPRLWLNPRSDFVSPERRYGYRMPLLVFNPSGDTRGDYALGTRYTEYMWSESGNRLIPLTQGAPDQFHDAVLGQVPPTNSTGSPAMLLWDNELVLAGVTAQITPPDYNAFGAAQQIAGINAAMTTLGSTAYQVTTVDLSGFKKEH
jgi:hypothetical protein